MSSKPRLLDLCCKAGGASAGYARAGFEVVGVDIEAQPRYPFKFIKADLLEFLAAGGARGFQVIAASPPCQKFSNTHHLWKREHPDLIAATRAALQDTGLPYVIENVPEAPLIEPVKVCGSGLGMRIRRHRAFESNVKLAGVGCQHKWQNEDPIFPGEWHRKGRVNKASVVTVFGNGGGGPGKAPVEVRAKVMEIDWMTAAELGEAIPPRFTDFIGTQIFQALR